MCNRESTLLRDHLLTRIAKRVSMIHSIIEYSSDSNIAIPDQNTLADRFHDLSHLIIIASSEKNFAIMLITFGHMTSTTIEFRDLHKRATNVSSNQTEKWSE